MTKKLNKRKGLSTFKVKYIFFRIIKTTKVIAHNDFEVLSEMKKRGIKKELVTKILIDND